MRVSKHDASTKDVLVVWVATNQKNETRIVGWYKNATVYREIQALEYYVVDAENVEYRIEALAKDCYLLPLEERNYKILRASRSGNGTGFGQSHIWYAESKEAQTQIIPKVIEYISSYKGKRLNKVYDEQLLHSLMSNAEGADDYEKLHKRGRHHIEKNETLEALIAFNTAKKNNATCDIEFEIGEALWALYCFDAAIKQYEHILTLISDNQVDRKDTLYCLIQLSDWKGDSEEVVRYCNQLISLLGDSKDEIEEALEILVIMFNIYIALNNENEARKIMDKTGQYSTEQAREYYESMKKIVQVND